MGNVCATNPEIDSVWFASFELQLPAMTGKRIAITGTTSGTGRVAALTCLKKGAEVFMLNRESERAQTALRQLQQACPGAALHHIPCDLMDFASVREAARQLQKACEGRLDVLCNNAGIVNLVGFATVNKFTKDGYGELMQTNHLSHFLLTKEMLPALRAAAEQNGEARIVSHSSDMRCGKPIDAKYFAKNGACDESDAYHQSKLANVLFSFELADRLASERIKALVCAPGFAVTNITHDLPSCVVRIQRGCFVCLGGIQSAEDGAMPLLTSIAGPDASSGDLLTPSYCGERKGPVMIQRRPLVKQDECQSKDSQRLLWAESERAISEEFKI